MATTQDLVDIQAQITERIGVLREGFGVLESDFNKLHQEDQAFDFDLDLDLDNQLRQTLKQDTERLHHLEEDLATRFETHLRADISHLKEEFHEAKTALSEHVDHHRDGHHNLHEGMATFDGEIHEAGSELEHAKEEFVGQVQGMADELSDLAEKVFSTSGDLAHSVQDTQTQIIDKAASAFKDLLGGHLDSLLPGHFEQTMGNLTHAVSDLGEQCNTIGSGFQNELETLLQHVGEFAVQEVQNKVQEKFQKLIQEALSFLAEQITESIAATTAGAAITGVMSPILPELAVLKAATELIKEAIAVFKALEDAFGL